MRITRRRFLRDTAFVTGGAAALSTVPGGVWARPAWADSGPVRVYVVVIDGLRPEKVDPVRTPFLLDLAADGTYWPDARAEMIAETTPNHVAMLTGMRADRHGMPGNSVPGRVGFNPRVGDNPRYLKADTLFTVARRQAPELVTAAVTSKEYLVHMSHHDRDGDGEPDATHVYEPRVYIPESDHETDHLVMEEVQRVTSDLDPDFCFVNLGDVDRVGHVDASALGGPLPPPLWYEERVNMADTLLRLHVEQLKAEDKWDHTVYIVTADHSMDWSLPLDVVNLHPSFQEDPLLEDEVVIGLNGGAAMYGLRHPDEPRAHERLTRMREIALGTEGVRSAWYTRPNPDDGGDENWVGTVHPEWGLAGDRTGELVVEVEEGWRVTETDQTSNPIPGNHGHAVTIPIPLIVSGGWAGLRRGQVIDSPGGLEVDGYHPDVARNIDVGPTAAWLLGLGPPRGGFDGRVLTEAFEDVRPPAAVTVDRDAPAGPHLHRHAGTTPDATTAEVSQVAHPDGAAAVVIVAADAPQLALAATTFAVGHGAPVLLGRQDGLADEVAAEVERLGPDRAFLIGGEEHLGDAVVGDLAAAGVDEDGVRRIAGDGVYETARLLAVETGAEHGEAVLVSGESGTASGWSAAVAIGPVAAAAGRAILLTRPDEVPDATWTALADAGVERVTVAGGTGDVSDGVVDTLRDAGLLVERIDGGDRFRTARNAAERGVREGGLTDVLWVVGEHDLVGGLAGASAAAAGSHHFDDEADDGGPFWFMAPGQADAVPTNLLVVPRDDLAEGSDAVRYLEDRRDAFVHVRLVGDGSAISGDVQDQIGGLLGAIGSPDVPGRADDGSEPSPDDDAPVTPVTGGGGAAALGAGAAMLGAALRGRSDRADSLEEDRPAT